MRRNAALAFPPNVAAPLVVKYELLKDSEKLVRLAALLALADAGPDDVARRSPSLRPSFGGSVDDDRWLPDAATAAGARTPRASS